MKRLVTLLFAVVIAAISYGQVDNVKNHEGDVNVNLKMNSELLTAPITYWHTYFAAGDTVSSTDSTHTYSYSVRDVVDGIKVAARLLLDSVSGTPTTTVVLQGKIFWDDAWTTVETETWAGTSADTTLLFDYTTAKPYRFWRTFHDCTATTAQKYLLQEQEIKVYK